MAENHVPVVKIEQPVQIVVQLYDSWREVIAILGSEERALAMLKSGGLSVRYERTGAPYQIEAAIDGSRFRPQLMPDDFDPAPGAINRSL